MRAFSTRLKHAQVELVNNFGLKLELLSNALLPSIIFQALLCHAQIYRTHSLPQVIGTFSDVQFSQLVRGILFRRKVDDIPLNEITGRLQPHLSWEDVSHENFSVNP